MDQGSNQDLAVDATSVTFSFANLELNPSPFNQLPNEILIQILSKVERMVQIQKFVIMRAVDTRWQSVVDHICKEKKSLVLVIRDQYSRERLQVEDAFFGLLDVNIESQLVYGENVDDAVVDKSIFESLLTAMPNIELLCIFCRKSKGLERQIAEYANSIGPLKKLYLEYLKY